MAAVYASADLGGTNIKCAYGDKSGRIICSDCTPTQSHEGPRAVLDRIASLVNTLSRKAGPPPAGHLDTSMRLSLQRKVRSHILERSGTGGCPCVESGDCR